MSAPTWATVIGILMMLFAGCGACNSLQNTQFSANLDRQGDLVDKITKSMGDDIGRSDIDSTDLTTIIDTTEVEASEVAQEKVTTTQPEEVKEMIGQMLSFSDETKMWIERFGYIGLFGAIIYFFGGLFLLIPKSFSIPLAYTALGLSIVISLGQWYVLSGDGAGFLKVATGVGAVIGVVIDIIFGLLIYVSDKYSYYPDEVFQD